MVLRLCCPVVFTVTRKGNILKKKNIYIYIYIYIPAPPSGTDKCVLLGCLVHFFGKRADSENNLIFEHIF